MLSKEENDFIRYWDQNRLRRKKTARQFLLGIPAGLLIVVPIAINFTSGWYKRANMEANSGDFNPMVLFVALLCIVGFTAIFWQRHKWDQLEQRYLELLARRARETQPEPAPDPSPGTSADRAPVAPPQAAATPPDPSPDPLPKATADDKTDATPEAGLSAPAR